MKKYLLIGIGGVIGAVLRYSIKGMHMYPYMGYIPIDTLIINVTGSFLLAFILTASYEFDIIDSNARLAIGTGFLGAYTTFSTMCKETTSQINNEHYLMALTYIIGTTILGLISAYFGALLAGKAFAKLGDRWAYGNLVRIENAVDLQEEGD